MRKNNEVRHQETLSRLASVEKELAVAQGKLDALQEQKTDTEERNQLKREVADLQVQKSKIEEETARKIRETEHRVGLLQKKQDQDHAHAIREVEVKVREAELKVREDNLSKDIQRFEDQMKFQQSQLKGEVDRVADILNKAMDLIPQVNLTGSIAPAQATRTPARVAK
jgi:chromosome segregation ATPase